MSDQKNILVIGGSSGIGKATLAALNGTNVHLINASRSSANLSNVLDVTLDVTTDFDIIDQMPDKLHGLVYCPGSINLKPFQSLKSDDYLKDFNINVLGAVKVIKASLKALKASGNASIVLFSTVAVSQGMSFHASVAASKGALEGLTRSLAAEYAKSNIRVNAIAPSITDTPLASALLASDERRKLSEDRHPIKAIGRADDIAAMVKFLLSENAQWMTGQIVHMDGGLSTLKTN
jgi:NAD(P)-dependent dehydrogenase (short-subunit alcohol dehydrogenase family)